MTTATTPPAPALSTTDVSVNGSAVQVVGAEADAAWDAALAASPSRAPFLKSAFQAAWERAFEAPVERIGCREQGRLVAGLAGRVRGVGSDRRLDHLALIPYTGVWISAGPAALAHRADRRRRRILSALAEFTQSGYARAAIDCHPDCIDMRAFTWSGWRCEPRYTLTTDLTRLDEAAFDPDVRRRARRAAEAGVVCTDAVSPDEFAAIWRRTHARQGVELPLSEARLARFIDGVRCCCGVEMRGARDARGALLAANVVLVEGDAAWYWLAGFDSEAPHDGSPLLTVETLRGLAGRCHTFDWVGANTPSVAEFKQSFGPTLTPYFRVTCRSDAVAPPAGWWRRIKSGLGRSG